MKVISIYELLGLIKDGKAPKKIKCDGIIYNYEFQNTIPGAYEYRTQNYNCLINNMVENLYLTDIINKEVEILDEEDEFEDIEEKDVYIELCGSSWKSEQEVDLIDNLTRFNLAINKIIRNQKKIIDKLNSQK